MLKYRPQHKHLFLNLVIFRVYPRKMNFGIICYLLQRRVLISRDNSAEAAFFLIFFAVNVSDFLKQLIVRAAFINRY